jgi:hypothetical protein
VTRLIVWWPITSALALWIRLLGVCRELTTDVQRYAPAWSILIK